MKDKVLKNIKNLFEYEKQKENYYKPVREKSFWKNSYIEYKSNRDNNNYQLNNIFIKLDHI